MMGREPRRFVAKALRRQDDGTAKATMRPAWGLGDAVAGFLVAQLASSLVIVAWLSITRSDEASLLVLGVGQLGLWVGLLGAPLRAARRKGSGDLRHEFGLGFEVRDGQWVLLGVVCQIVALPVLYFLIELVVGDLDVGAPARELADRFTGLGYVILAVLVVLVAPVVEEIFYRGLLLRAATRRWGERVAILVSSAWFGASHFQLVQFPALFGLGVVLAVLACRSRSLGPPIAAHVGFNAVTIVALAISP